MLHLFSAWRHSCAQSFWSSCKLSNFAFFLTWAPYLPALVPERRDADDLVPVEGIARVRPDAEEGASAVSLAGILTFKYIITGESWIEPAKPNVATTKLGGLVGTRFGDYLCLDCCVFKWMPSIYLYIYKHKTRQTYQQHFDVWPSPPPPAHRWAAEIATNFFWHSAWSTMFNAT